MNVFAKFDEIPSMILQHIKEIKCYGHKNVTDTRLDVKTVYPPTNTVCGGIINVPLVISRCLQKFCSLAYSKSLAFIKGFWVCDHCYMASGCCFIMHQSFLITASNAELITFQSIRQTCGDNLIAITHCPCISQTLWRQADCYSPALSLLCITAKSTLVKVPICSNIKTSPTL